MRQPHAAFLGATNQYQAVHLAPLAAQNTVITSDRDGCNRYVSGALVVRGHLDELQLLRAARIVNPDTPIARARGEKWQGGRPGDAGYSVRVTFQNSNAFP